MKGGGEARRHPESISDVLKAYLKETGLAVRVEEAAVVPEWPALVGERIAAVTEPLFVTPDAMLFVAVRTNAWMTELQLMEPELLRALNASAGRLAIRKIRFQLMR